MSIRAKYTSVWDDSIELTSDCEYEPDTDTCFDIDSVDVNVDALGMLTDEYVTLPDGTVIRDCIFEY